MIGLISRSTTRPARRGAALLAVLVCLFVASLGMVGLTRCTLMRMRQQRQQHAALQTQWLAWSAAQRAETRAAKDSSYTGETWSLPASTSGLRDDAVVRILIDRPPDQALQFQIQVLYPAVGPWQQQLHRQWTGPARQ